MRLSFQDNVAGLSAETQAEKDICELLRASDGQHLRRSSPRMRSAGRIEAGSPLKGHVPSTGMGSLSAAQVCELG